MMNVKEASENAVKPTTNSRFYLDNYKLIMNIGSVMNYLYNQTLGLVVETKDDP